ncbi:MAG: hypothetical protein M3R07_00615 [Gemmatimonadota bacterium]|nr:hypothetical protein [Gemmatimonadota bacterium]
MGLQWEQVEIGQGYTWYGKADQSGEVRVLGVFRSIICVLAGMGAIGCGGPADGGVGPDVPASTFGLIQTRVFADNCTNCHTSGSAFAKQSGLSLDRATAYRNLVNAPSLDPGARSEGLLRVVPGDAERSLLYQKLILWDPNHTRHYGAPMPLGGQSLTVGQIDFIRRWINAGAPETGEVVDAGVLNDLTRPTYAPFAPLPPPERGYQVKSGPFEIAPRFERELFIRRDLGNSSPAYITRIETRMRNNSHHLLLYTFTPNIPAAIMPPADVIRDIRRPDGTLDILKMLPMGYHVFFGGSMTPTGGFQFPAGVALELPANAVLDLNSHYVNTTNAPITGEIFANLHTVDRAAVTNVARTLFMNNEAITLPPNQRTTVSKTFKVSVTTTIIMLSSHMHKHGEKFVVRVSGGPRNGEIVYESTDWADPVIRIFAEPIVLRAGEGLTSEVTYNNTTSATIRFGLTSEDEMDIIFGYYY